MAVRLHELCEFCPKLCRAACPAADASAREALTPWAKVSLAAICGRAPDAEAALAFATCTGCGGCVEHCAHPNDVPGLLYAARAAAVRAGVAPRPWTELALRFSARGHGERVDLAAVHRALPPSRGPALLFAGCEALARGGDEARDALLVAEKLRAPLGLVAEAALCCGRKLAEGGHPELQRAHAARLRPSLVRGRRPVHLVFLDPDCAAEARDRWELPRGSRVEHVTTYLWRALAAIPETDRPPRLPDVLAFHDPCGLARRLRETEAPRRLLAAAVARVVEAPRHGTQTSCCGASGLMPRTLPGIAARMAAARRDELGAPAATSSPACAAALGATAVVSVLARWLAQGTH